MPKIDYLGYLVQAISKLTGGLIADLATLFTALVCLAFIAMGADLLISYLSGKYQRYQETNEYNSMVNQMNGYRNRMDEMTHQGVRSDSQEYEIENMKYQQMRKRVASAEIERGI